MAKAYIVYDATLRVITPLHIGNGHELLHHYDYVAHAGKTWRLNEMALLEAQQADDLAIAEQLARTPPGQLLTPADFQIDAEWFRYVIDGVPRTQGEGAPLREQIKDAYDRIYLPGSSIKGAVRTSLGWYAWASRKYDPPPTILGKSDKRAASEIEKELYGSSPNFDWLRALHVADSLPLSPTNLTVENASVLRGNGAIGAPIKLEAIRVGTLFETTIKVDSMLFTAWADALQFEARQKGLLTHIPEIIQRHSKLQLRRLYKRTQAMEHHALAERYQRLAAAELPPNQCLLPLGWGTGWMSKTFGIRLLKNEPLRRQIFSRYKHSLSPQGQLPADADFPSSQRVIVNVEESGRGNKSTTPRAPFGWVLLELQERK